jgi:hypothetical protein
LNGVKIIYGEFKKRDKFCRICKKTYQTFEEKQTDVNIAIQLFKLSIQEKYDKALIISGDSDLIPSIEAVKSTFPNKACSMFLLLVKTISYRQRKSKLTQISCFSAPSTCKKPLFFKKLTQKLHLSGGKLTQKSTFSAL